MTEPIEVSLESDVEEEVEVKTNKVEKASSDFDLKCNIKDLTEAQYNKILQDLKSGKEYKYFTYGHLKNGTTVLRKKNPPTKLQTIAKRSKESNSIPSDKVYMTNEQQMFEHIIAMREEISNLKAKNKKRKYENRELYDMYYVDEDEIDDEKHNQFTQNTKTDENRSESERSVNGPSVLSSNGAKPKTRLHWSQRIKNLR
jgi:hypothetical protein